MDEVIASDTENFHPNKKLKIHEDNPYTYSIRINLLDLPWDDILIPLVLSRLSLPDLISFSQVNESCENLANLTFRQLHELNLYQCPTSVTLERFSEISKHFSQLVCILCKGADHLLEDGLFVRLLRNNPNISEIDLSNCNTLSQSSFQAISSFCPKLQKLYLRYTAGISGTAISNILLRCTHITCLELDGSSVVSDELIQMLLLTNSKLRVLSLCEVRTLTNTAVLSIACCRPLQHLDLRGCPSITVSGVREVVHKCLNLKYLGVEDFCLDLTLFQELRARGVTVCRSPLLNHGPLKIMASPVVALPSNLQL